MRDLLNHVNLAVMVFLFALFLSLIYCGPIKLTFTAAEIQDYTDRHNYLRQSRCVSDITWSDQLAQV